MSRDSCEAVRVLDIADPCTQEVGWTEDNCPTPDGGLVQGVEQTGSYKPACAQDPACLPQDAKRRRLVAPGLVGLAAVYDPGSKRVWIHGGSTGCVGNACEAWQALFDADLSGDAYRYAANNEQVLRWSPGAASPFQMATADERRELFPRWPVDASLGFSRSGAAPRDLAWLPEERRFGSTSPGLSRCSRIITCSRRGPRDMA